MSYYVGAYASSPNVTGWNPELETRYYAALKSLDNIQGLEHPYVGRLHAHDDEWFLSNIDPEWDFVFTCVPGIMAAKSKNPLFGIASDDESGRLEALDFLKGTRDAVEKLNKHLGRQAVKAVQLQTSPSQNVAPSSVEALQRSLETLVAWDWQGARLVIEHCDAYIEGQNPAKGFLSLKDEIQAISATNQSQNSHIGININWGRSVIETRSCEGAVEHIQQAKAHDLLSGLMFSGVSDTETAYGLWSDSHMPPAKYAPDAIGAEGSLMTEAQMHRCLEAAGSDSLDFVGVKLGIRPREATFEERVAYNRDALTILDRFFQK